jgi:endonuclease/exonuclease/phosphatase family metal-dependent hydrolase
VWFGDFWRDERCAALLAVLRRLSPDLVALQEVTPPYLARLLAEDWVRRDYWVSDASGATVSPHGVLLLGRPRPSRLALRRLPSDKDRKLLVAELHLNGCPLHLANVHLESAADNAPLRLTQLGEVLPLLSGTRHSVILGDFNFDPSQEAEQARLEASHLDLWALLRPGEPGYTEDTSINRMRLLHKGKERQARFDRIFLRSADPGWRPEAIELIATDPLGPALPDVFPSDHFGLFGVLTWGARSEVRRSSSAAPR